MPPLLPGTTVHQPVLEVPGVAAALGIGEGIAVCVMRGSERLHRLLTPESAGIANSAGQGPWFPALQRMQSWGSLFRGRATQNPKLGQPPDHEEARGEVTLYASQSGEARVGRIAGTMALEQLPVLSSRGERCGADQRRLGQNFVSGSGRLKPSLPASVVPAPAKIAGAGHPFFILCVSD